MKYCEEYAALLDPYIDGELSAGESARVRAHLETCGGCRAYVEAALAMRDAFPHAEDAQVPDGFAEGVMAAVRAGAAPRKKRRAPWAKVLLPLAACCAVVALVQELPRPALDGMAAPAADTAAEAAPRDSLGDLTCSIDGCGDFSVDAPSPKTFAQEASPAQKDAGQNAEAAPFSLAPSGEQDAPLPREAEQQVPAAENAFEEPSSAAGDIGTLPGDARSGWDAYFAVLRLPGALSACLPAGAVPAGHADGETRYELTAPEYDALMAALAETEGGPEVLFSAPERREAAESRALVLVPDA